MKIFLAIDIGGTAVKCGIVTSEGEILHKFQVGAFRDGYFRPLLESVKIAASKGVQLAKERGIVLSGLCISATGEVNVNKNEVVGGCGSIPDWEHIDFEKELSHLSLPMTVLNDANAATLGEGWLGGGKGLRDFVLYTIGTGIGGGVITGGKLLNGARGYAGNLGHMVISDGTEECPCGNSGCFERLASTRALLRKAKEVGFNGGGKELFANANDPKLKVVLDNFFHYHGVAIGNIIHIFNPQRILIGGGVSAQGDNLLGRIKKEAEKHTMPHYFQGTEIEIARLGNDAGLVGAVKYFMDVNYE